MQKKLLALSLILCMLAAMMTGCGGNSAPQASPASEPSGAADAPSQEAIPSSQEVSEPPVEEPEPEPEPVKTWFEEQGLVITPQGDFTFITAAGSAEREILDTFEVMANVVITETTDGVETGYKKVIAVFTQNNDESLKIPGAVGSWSWVCAFDRYTGTALLYDSEAEFVHPHEQNPEGEFVTIVIGEDRYDLSLTIDQPQSLPVAIKECTVICPVDYDGIVFFTGYSDAEREKQRSEFDYTARLYTLDELTSPSDGYYYFSYTNQ